MTATIKARLFLDTGGISGGSTGSKGGGGNGTSGIGGTLMKMLGWVAGIAGILFALKPIMALLKLVMSFLMIIIWPFIKPLMLVFAMAAKGLLVLISAVIKFIYWFGSNVVVPILTGIDKIISVLSLGQIQTNLGGGVMAGLDSLAEWANATIIPLDNFVDKLIESYKKDITTLAESTQVTDTATSTAERQTKAQEEQTVAVEETTESMQGLTLVGTTAKDVWSRVMRSLFDSTTQFSGYMKQLGDAFGFKPSGVLGAGFDESQTSDSKNKSINFMGTGKTVREVMRYSGNTLWDAIKSNYGIASGGGTGSTGSGKGINAGGGARFYDANLMITSGGRVLKFDSQDNISIGAKKGYKSGTGANVTVNINNPSVRNEGDIKEMVRRVSAELKKQLGGRNNYSPV